MTSRRRRQERSDPPGRYGWADLPPELLECIMDLLAPLGRVAVRLVCSPWRACARASYPSDLPFEAPRLLLRRPGPGGILAFFSLHRREILPFALPARTAAGRCCGHIGGWLAMAFDEDRSLALCNLVTGESVAVPPAPVFPVAKMLLSAPPTSPGWVAAAVGRGGTIALLQPDASGDWITIDEGAERGGFKDVAFWRGRVCALGDDGSVVAFRANLAARVAAASELRARDHPVDQFRRGYLVESEGELVVVRRRYILWRAPAAMEVEVEVLLFVAGKRRWEAVKALPGRRALFVGKVESLSAAAGPGIEENCVYFARGELEMTAPHAIGVYSVKDRSTVGVAIAGGHSVTAEPVWISPSLPLAS